LILLLFFNQSSERESMLKWFKTVIGTLRSSVRSRHELALENLALSILFLFGSQQAGADET